MNNINELTPDNCAFALIDHQPWVAFPVRSITPEELLNNVTALAKVACALGIPTVLSTVFAEGGRLADPLFEQLRRVFPDVRPIDRRNTNAWSDPAFVAAVRKTGRRKLVMAGLFPSPSNTAGAPPTASSTSWRKAIRPPDPLV
jgi:nicotinamidase-related amidase